MIHRNEEKKEFRNTHINLMKLNNSEQESAIFIKKSHSKADLCQKNIYMFGRRSLNSHYQNNNQVIKMSRITTQIEK